MELKGHRLNDVTDSNSSNIRERNTEHERPSLFPSTFGSSELAKGGQETHRSKTKSPHYIKNARRPSTDGRFESLEDALVNPTGTDSPTAPAPSWPRMQRLNTLRELDNEDQPDRQTRNGEI